MWITSDEAVVMFARYCRARLGKRAAQQVRAKAKELEMRGDIDGRDIWNKVAAEIETGTKPRWPEPAEMTDHYRGSARRGVRDRDRGEAVQRERSATVETHSPAGGRSGGLPH
jgi:hypothetical protein